MGGRNDVFEGGIFGDLNPRFRAVPAIVTWSARPKDYAGRIRIARRYTIRIQIATLRPALP